MNSARSLRFLAVVGAGSVGSGIVQKMATKGRETLHHGGKEDRRNPLKGVFPRILRVLRSSVVDRLR
jgi:ketopantoate reductase